MPWTPLILDAFIFDEARLETPESFGDLGGTQSIEQHDFPGGTRTQKSYGYFPAAQKWRAKSHGADASERALGVGRIMASGREVKLQYGDHSWLGRVARFSPTARHSWLYEWEIEFWPRLDYASPGTTLPTVTDLGTVLAQHTQALQSLIQYGLDPAVVGQAVAATIGVPAGFLISQVNAAMAAAGGVVVNITDAWNQAIQVAAVAASAACLPYQIGLNPVWSSPAADANARIMAIQNLMDFAVQPIAMLTLPTINPNLPLLAAQYYSDAAQWRNIALANPLVNGDPQPIGSFTLVIPQPEP